jgi:DNA-binding XRE family transcriptional regulator
MFDRNKFSLRLRELRLNNSLKQKDLGQILEVTDAAITQLEKGKRSPSIELAVALADYFDVSLDYLVGRSDDPARR